VFSPGAREVPSFSPELTSPRVPFGVDVGIADPKRDALRDAQHERIRGLEPYHGGPSGRRHFVVAQTTPFPGSSVFLGNDRGAVFFSKSGNSFAIAFCIRARRTTA
jgi:hypothetical protein